MTLGPERSDALEAPVVDLVGTVEESVPPEPTAPERIGRYELCFELASGGMATVYLAKAEGPAGFEKLVALKRIHRHLAKETRYIEMFLDEARIASRITHPNVCSVFDFGEADGEYYIAMEYLVGEPLSRLCLRVVKDEAECLDPLRSLRMATIIAHACEGIHAAHELKDANGDLLHVIHRDVSPRNLFVTYDGSVQVVDFGVASARQRLHQTVAGEMKGTFAYMAPEQLETRPIGRQVDVWALGVTLWETLALKRLFRRATTAKTVHAVLYDEVRPPSRCRPNIPPELDEIVMKALQREPADRWQSAREMGRALRHYLASQPEIIGPAELSEWLTKVFPQGEARKSQLLEIARMRHEPVPSIRLSDHTMEAATPSDDLLWHKTSVHSTTQRKALVVVGAVAALAVAAAAFAGLADSDDKRPEPQTSSKDVTESAASSPPQKSPALPVASKDATESEQNAAPKPAAKPEASAQDEATTKPATERNTRKKGAINVVTRGGWARVYKGKKLLGTTPTRITLPAGRHRLTLKPFGTGKARTVHVKVSPNRTKNVSIRID